MAKTRNDEVYEQGVKNGQRTGLSGEFMHGLTHDIADIVTGSLGLSPEQEYQIEEKGYQYGLSHPAAANHIDSSSHALYIPESRNSDSLLGSDNDSGDSGSSEYGISHRWDSDKKNESSSNNLSVAGGLVLVAGMMGVLYLATEYNSRSVRPNLTESPVAYYHPTLVDYHYPLEKPREINPDGTLSSPEPEGLVDRSEDKKFYLSYHSLKLEYLLSFSDCWVNISVSVPDESLVKFCEAREGWFKTWRYILDGELTKRLDVNNDKILNSEELAHFYDFIGFRINQKLEENGYSRQASYLQQRSLDKLAEEINTLANSWTEKIFIPQYISHSSNKNDVDLTHGLTSPSLTNYTGGTFNDVEINTTKK